MIAKDWLPPLPKNVERGCEIYMYPDGTSIHASSVQVHSDGGRAVLYRASTRQHGRGWVAISDVPVHLRAKLYAVQGNDWQDAHFRSPNAAAEMLHYLGMGPANTAG